LDHGTRAVECAESFESFRSHLVLHAAVAQTAFVALVAQILDRVFFTAPVLANFDNVLFLGSFVVRSRFSISLFP
tara:strand:- start:29269 stop:29493 length:225 start_codon:yes stop_codon:yes gene_type:complete